MLIRELRVGESIVIGEVKITVLKKSGQVARLGVDAAKNISIKADEAKSKQENKAG